MVDTQLLIEPMRLMNSGLLRTYTTRSLIAITSKYMIIAVYCLLSGRGVDICFNFHVHYYSYWVDILSN